MKRRVFVTGGANGIGKSIVKAFADCGDTVAFCDIDSDQGNRLGTEFNVDFYNLDVTDIAALEKALTDFVSREGDIDVLINNVGIGIFKPLTDLSTEEFDRVINTNLRSAFITSRFIARVREKNGNKEYGRIINICSSRYKQSEEGTEAYSASKGGIYSLTHALTMSCAKYGITVNAIAPGWIHVRQEEILRPEDHDFHPSGRVGIPEDIARMCLFLAEPGNNFINGQTITVDGGTTIKMIYPE